VVCTCKLVFLNEFSWDVCDFDVDILRIGHWGIKVEVLEVDGAEACTFTREHTVEEQLDQVVMELIFGKVIDKKTIRSLSRCQRSLEIIFLSDMRTADGRYLEQFVFDPGSKVAWSKYKFPRESPAKKDWDT